MNLTALAARHAASVRSHVAAARLIRRSAEVDLSSARTMADRLRLVRELGDVPGFFPTPDALGERLVRMAGIEPGMRVLEPSAGTGNLVGWVLGYGAHCTAVEVNPRLCAAISARFPISVPVICADFMQWDGERFDVAVMNPPFERRQDEAHLRRALTMAYRVVCLVSRSTGDRLAGEFEVETVEDGAFANAERRTMVRTSIVIARA